MSSLFLRILLWLGGGCVLLVLGLVVGLRISNPDAFAAEWLRMGRGAVAALARATVDAHERGAGSESERQLESLARAIGVDGMLFDLSGRQLRGRTSDRVWPIVASVAAGAEGQLVVLGGRIRDPVAGIKLRGAGGTPYVFVGRLPRRPAVWSRAFLASMALMAGLLSYALAWQLTAPVRQLRSLTSSFARGDLGTRIAAPRLLDRRDEIGALAHDFNDMAARIETLMKAQRRLLADVSHELRSPLTRLRLGLGLLRRRPEAGPEAALLRMERDVERLDGLIGQLLTLSRLESLGQSPPMDRVELHALVQEIASDADFEAKSMDRGVRVLECAPCTVHGAGDLLRSAIENVVRNALRYTERHTDVLIRLSHEPATGVATLVVEDHGPGVPAQDLPHLFEPFYRTDEARERHGGGAGLGLAITRQVVAIHGGQVSAENRPTGGLSVRITVPAAAAAEAR